MDPLGPGAILILGILHSIPSFRKLTCHACLTVKLLSVQVEWGLLNGRDTVLQVRESIVITTTVEGLCCSVIDK